MQQLHAHVACGLASQLPARFRTQRLMDVIARQMRTSQIGDTERLVVMLVTGVPLNADRYDLASMGRVFNFSGSGEWLEVPHRGFLAVDREGLHLGDGIPGVLSRIQDGGYDFGLTLWVDGELDEGSNRFLRQLVCAG